MSGVAIVGAEAFRYRLPLARPLAMPSGTYTQREGILLRLTDADGHVGWGDAAPLPGYSPDTLADVLAELPATLRWVRERRPWLDGLSLSFEGPAVRRPRGRGSLPRPPSLVCAVAQASGDLSSQQLGWSLARVYGWTERAATTRADPTVPAVALNALLPNDDPVPTARRVAAEGWRAAKLKVGRRSPEADAAVVREVAGVLGETALRLDANRAWSVEEATAFADALDGVPVAYVEEPLSDWRRQPEFARRTGVPFALDETLRDVTARPTRLVREAAAFVTKPTVLGGAGADASFLRFLAGRETPVVVSSTFESGVGMRHLVALAAALGDTPAGLDTYRWLAEDVLDRPLPMSGPTVNVAAVLAPNPVRLDRLEPLAL
ncbi:o-succinylbenzoate synthase [Rubrivirga sp.]|uniref:o-succinylbenzoate synthase n=1 Tax=Rubrivirga sp. TaxID=1885344 RepID=UPI003B52D71A